MEAEQQEEEEETVQVEQEEEKKVEEEDLAPACRSARPPPQVLTMRSRPKVPEIKI